MFIKFAMPITSFFLFSLLSLSNSLANDKAICIELIKTISEDRSFAAILENTDQNLKIALKKESVPNQTDIRVRRKQVWTGFEGPQAFKTFLSPGVSLLKTPDANTESRFMTMRQNPGISVMLHVEMPFKGFHTSTKVYMARPVATEQTHHFSDGEYLIGKQFTSVVIYGHGGGTPMAVGGNASSIGSYLAARGIPVLAFDQPGHGHGPTIPFIDDREVFLWNYMLMKKLIHPDVQIHFHGHSWGGMAAIRMWQLSHEMDFKRIVAYQSVCPAADMSLGKGSPREKVMLEREVSDNIIGANYEEWKSLSAESDLDFLQHTVEKGKNSPNAQHSTAMTDVGYRWREMSPEEIKKRVPINIIAGKYDAITYVKRNETYDRYSRMIAGDNYHLFDKATTFKGKNIKQGHQVFDAIDENNDFIAYQIGAQLVKRISGQDISKRNVDGLQNDVASLLNRVFNQFANNYAFQEFFHHHIEYSEILNQKHTHIIDEIAYLSKYVDEVSETKRKHASDYKRKLEVSRKTYAQSFNASTLIHKAKREIEVDNSAVRKKDLSDFIMAANHTITETKRSYKDSIYDNEMGHFKTEADQALGDGYSDAIIEYERYAEARRNVNSLSKRLSKLNSEDNPEEMSKIKKSLTRIYRELEVEEPQQIINAENNPLIIEIHTDHLELTENQLKTWKRNFEKYLQVYKANLKDYRKRFAEAIDKNIDELDRPEGIKRLADAEWEIKINLTPERKKQLEAFISGFDSNEEKNKALLDQDLITALGKIDPPKGFKDFDEAKSRLTMLQDNLNKRYIPEKNHSQFDEISTIVGQLKILDNEISNQNKNSFMGQLVILNQTVEKLKKERTGAVNKLEKLFELSNPSERQLEAMLQYDTDLNHLKTVNSRFYERQENFYLTLDEENLEPEAVRKKMLELSPELDESTKEYEEAQAAFFQSREQLNQVKFLEGRLGNLTSKKDPEGHQLKNLLSNLIGEMKVIESHTKITPSPKSIEGKISTLEKKKIVLEMQLYKTQVKIRELELEYQSLFASSENDTQDFYHILPINMYDLFDQEASTLATFLNTSEGKSHTLAIIKTLSTWDEMWVRVNQEDNFKRAEAYKIAPSKI